jgi:hypothetical protein
MVMCRQRHETGHLVFRDGDFLAAKFGLRDVLNFVVVAHGVFFPCCFKFFFGL